MNPMRPHLEHLIRWYSQLTPSSLSEINNIYTESAYFKDPFNEFRSREKIKAVFEHMFSSVSEPRFEISAQILEENKAFLRWDMHFIRNKKPQKIHGSSHLIFSPDGRINYHRDYWDTGEELYSKLPIFRFFIAQIRKRITAE
jgi:steroid delta-isomerase